jgi:hypothetical protein
MKVSVSLAMSSLAIYVALSPVLILLVQTEGVRVNEHRDVKDLPAPNSTRERTEDSSEWNIEVNREAEAPNDNSPQFQNNPSQQDEKTPINLYAGEGSVPDDNASSTNPSEETVSEVRR